MLNSWPRRVYLFDTSALVKRHVREVGTVWVRSLTRPKAAHTIFLASITAVVIGGTSLFGGRGRLVGTLIGALIVQTLQFGLSQMGVDQQWRVLATGILVIVAVAVDQWIRKVKS